MPMILCRNRSFERVSVVVLVLMFGVIGPPAFAQDGTSGAADTTGPAASQTGLLSEPTFMTRAINRLDNALNQSGEPKPLLTPIGGAFRDGRKQRESPLAERTSWRCDEPCHPDTAERSGLPVK